MTTWEYGELQFNEATPKLLWHNGTKMPVGHNNAVEKLNELGREGWELVGIAGEGSFVRYAMKRQLVS